MERMERMEDALVVIDTIRTCFDAKSLAYQSEDHRLPDLSKLHRALSLYEGARFFYSTS